MKGSRVLLLSLLHSSLLLSMLLCIGVSSSISSEHRYCDQADSLVLLQFIQHFELYKPPPIPIKAIPVILQLQDIDPRLRCQLMMNRTLDWNKSLDCCKWEGITCDSSTGHVTGLDLSCMGLQGSIHHNSTLFQLHHLRKLNLAFSRFHGSSLPNEIGSLTSLTHLNISVCGLSGVMPSKISHLSKLVSLDLAGNFNYDQIRYSSLLFLQNLTQLELLDLSSIGISSTIPTNISASLRYLDLSFNDIVGSIPDSIFQLSKLQSLILSSNINLVGSLPKFSWSCNNTLQQLDLSQTGILGELPNSIGNLKSLNYFLLSQNKFSSSIPESIGNLTQLKELDFSSNEFKGSVPFTISNLNQLTTLDLSSNYFEGEIPNAFSNLQELTTLDLEGNNFTGLFPSSIVNLTRLEGLSLEEYSLIGSLPYVATRLQNLRELFLCGNALNGTIPPWIFSLPSLIRLDLSQNQFTGKLLGILSESLETIDLSNNQLDGQISLTFSRNKTSLKNIDLSNNKLEGQIPTWFTSMYWSELEYLDFSQNHLIGGINQLLVPNIVYLDLHSNQLQGPLPITICNSSVLGLLNLKYNKFNGSIPECLGELDQLSVLDLGMNNFNGILPSFNLSNPLQGCGLTALALNENQLQGLIPISLVNCTMLEVIDLGNNKLIDTFPNWLECLQELQVLILSSNQLYGPITSLDSKIPFPKLRIFDLSCNHFTGVLPKYFFNNFKAMINVDQSQKQASYLDIDRLNDGNYIISINLVMKGNKVQLQKVLTILTTIDLSSNQIEGELPRSIGNLNSLRLLNLSHNCFNGSIPHQLGDIKFLESLDISWNQLTGRIPEHITSLTFLEVLNLSQNHLVGPIPTGKQFNTFENNSYGGNINLCGFPLSMGCNDNSRSHETHQHVEQEEKSDFLSGFTWRAVVIGFGCGMVFGILIENIMSRIGKPEWFVNYFYGGNRRRKVSRPKKNGQRH